MNKWMMLSQFRSGSTLICQYIAWYFDIPNYDEIFHPFAIKGTGPHGSGVVKRGPYTYYKYKLSKKQWVAKGIGNHLNKRKLDLINNFSDKIIICVRYDIVQHFCSWVLMDRVNYHWKSKANQPNWNSHIGKITVNFKLLDKFKKELKVFYGYVSQVAYDKVISYEAWGLNENPGIVLANEFGFDEKKSVQFFDQDYICRKLNYNKEDIINNIDQVKEWINNSDEIRDISNIIR